MRIRNGSSYGAAIGFLLGSGVALCLLFAGWQDLGRSFEDPDDAMRLVQVRDWMAGQAWGDVSQRRMQPPEGTPMHWSRVDDLPVAATLALASPLGRADAERLALAVWPVALVPLLFAFLGAVAAGIARDASAALAATCCCLACSGGALLSRFSPGRIDHHAVMTTLASVAAGSLFVGPRYAAGVACGTASALCLAVGFEDLATLAVLWTGVGAAWTLGAEPRFARGMSDGLAAATAIAAAALVPSGYVAGTACDMLSGGWLLTTFVAASGLAVSTRVAGGKRSRLAASAGTATAAFAVAAATLRPCLAGPFAALDRTVVDYWLSGVGEMKDVWTFSGGRVDVVASLVAVPLAALVVAAASSSGRSRWVDGRAAYVATLLTAVVLGLRFVRNAGLPVALGAPILGAAVSVAWSSGRTRAAAWLLAAAALPLTLATMDFAFPDAALTRTDAARRACASSAAWKGLADLPKGRVMTPVDSGAYVLAFTPDEVVAGGYHRADRGLRDVVAFMWGTPEEAREIARRDEVDYVAWCASSAEMKPSSGRGTKGMAVLMEAGRLPPWLEAVPSDGPVRLAKVVWKR